MAHNQTMKRTIPIKSPLRNLLLTTLTPLRAFTSWLAEVLILPTALNLSLTLILSPCLGLSVTLALTLTSNTNPFLNSNACP